MDDLNSMRLLSLVIIKLIYIKTSLFKFLKKNYVKKYLYLSLLAVVFSSASCAGAGSRQHASKSNRVSIKDCRLSLVNANVMQRDGDGNFELIYNEKISESSDAGMRCNQI